VAITNLQQSISAVSDTLSEVEKLGDKDRSVIAKRVVWLYVAVTVACFAFILYIFWFLTPCSGIEGETGCLAWQPPAEFLLKVISTVVLPVVTLVLGYYFGTKAES